MNTHINPNIKSNQSEINNPPIYITLSRNAYERIAFIAKLRGMTASELIGQQLSIFLDEEFEKLKNKVA